MGTFLMGPDTLMKRPVVKPEFQTYSTPVTAERVQHWGSTEDRVPSHSSLPRLGTARECLPEAKAVLASNSQLRRAADSDRQPGRLALN